MKTELPPVDSAVGVFVGGMADDGVEEKSKRSPSAGVGAGAAAAAAAVGVGELVLKAPNPLEGLNFWVA